MDIPAVQLLCLEQQDRSLEDHTRDFLDLACLKHFPDRSLGIFYITSLSERCKARLPANGPEENFVEWVLERNGLYFSICPTEEVISSPTHEPETSQPSSRCTELLPEPTADGEPEPAATEPIIATEPEPQASSDQVREPATSSVPEGVLVVIEGLEGSPAHTPATEGELQLVSGNHIEELMDIFERDLIDWFGEVLPSAPVSPELIRWNQNRDDNRWAPANEIVVCALAPTTREVLKSWRIPKELRYFDRKTQQRISFTCSASILHVTKDSLALYLSLRARVCVCVCETSYGEPYASHYSLRYVKYSYTAHPFRWTEK